MFLKHHLLVVNGMLDRGQYLLVEGIGEDTSRGAPHVVEGQGASKSQTQVLPQVGVRIQTLTLGCFLHHDTTVDN